MADMIHGFEEGETCGRDGCTGVITATHEPEGCCSCHIAPPCGYCTTPREECPECGWIAADDMVMAEAAIHLNGPLPYIERKPKVWDRSKIDYTISMHSNASQKVTGVFPPGTKQDEVRRLVNGTFGGRFEKWDETKGEFVFIAYTD